MEVFNLILSIFGFFIGGFLSSYLIAKFVIPKSVEEKIKLSEKEKITFFTNLRKVIVDTNPATKKMSKDFKTKAEYDAYNSGLLDGHIGTQELLCNIRHYGTEETRDMFENDWTKNSN